MKIKKRIALIFGGKSAEHEVSINSAQAIFEHLDQEKYQPVLIYINKSGNWYFVKSVVNPEGNILGECILILGGAGQVVKENGQKEKKFDLAFPILHGPYGEDGSVQGLLKLAGVPFVGAGVLGSAVGMDKDVMKRLLKEAGLPIGDFLIFCNNEQEKINFDEIVRKLGLPFFVKPANLGSSVGISKVQVESEFLEAIKEAFSFDSKIIIEKNIFGREIECAIFGNSNPKASILGEIVASQKKHDFYSYQAKYFDENGVSLIVPASLSQELVVEAQDLAIKVFKILNCVGLARVDFFLSKENKWIVNEINTIPGFTKFSMYPRLWEASGVSFKALISELIELALGVENNK
ncbi:D-alanine--D-alanine ligase [Candidatus Nomurabacteria bacterium]|nr:D-alanine--D-alanine ligase [Candidatus Nomurabacteria bacterium]